MRSQLASARTSLNLFHEIQPEWQGGVTVMKEFVKGLRTGRPIATKSAGATAPGAVVHVHRKPVLVWAGVTCSWRTNSPEL